MTDHYDLADEVFFDLMENCALQKKYFSHSAHLRLAWIHIQRFGATKAEQTVPDQIKRYVNHIGMGDKFNMTLSVASVKLISKFIDQYHCKTFESLNHRVPQLQNNFIALIEVYYTKIYYNSIQAKKEYLEPNLQAFE